MNDKNIYVWATGTDGVSIPSQWIAWSPGPNGTSVATISTTANGVFPSYVLDDPSFGFHWYAAVPGSSVTIDLGCTTNELYLSNCGTPPRAGVPGDNYDSVVYLGCHNACGLSQDDAIVNAIWNNAFSSRAVTSKSGAPLHYYQNYLTGVTDTAGLLASGDGQCGSWVHLIQGVLGAQGITSVGVTIKLLDDNPKSGFLIKNWQFGTPNASSVVASPDYGAVEAQYPYVDVAEGAGSFYSGIVNATHNGYNFSYSGVADLSGVAGQSNSNPFSVFNNHQVLEYTYPNNQTFWFDPSYGNVYSGSTTEARLADFQSQCVAGFYAAVDGVTVNQSYLTGDDHGTGQLARTVLFIKPNDGTLQLTTGPWL